MLGRRFQRLCSTLGASLLLQGCAGTAREPAAGRVTPSPPDDGPTPAHATIAVAPISTVAVAAAPVAAAPPSIAAGTPPAVRPIPACALDDPKLERRILRIVVNPRAPSYAADETYVLVRGRGRVCLRESFPMVSPEVFAGASSDAILLSVPAQASFEGPAASPSTVLRRVEGSEIGTLGSWPETLSLKCRLDTLPVLAAGAHVVIDESRLNVDNTLPWSWQPATTERTAVLRCDLTGKYGPDDTETFYFAVPRRGRPGIERVRETATPFPHSSLFFEATAYRWIADTP